MRLTCFYQDGRPTIIPAPMERDWMDATAERFAYRCLPLNIANAHGWQILNPAAFTAEWNGEDAIDSVTIRPSSDVDPAKLPTSHFGYGVLTFHIGGLFRTDPGYDLFAMSPVNSLKDGIQALAGVIETDWSVATFTMNWKFTRANVPVAFERDEPFCMIFPVQRGLVEACEPDFQPIRSEPELDAGFGAWAHSRDEFVAKLKTEDEETRRRKWQRDYFAGAPLAGKVPESHRTRLRPKPFRA